MVERKGIEVARKWLVCKGLPGSLRYRYPMPYPKLNLALSH